MSHDPTAEQAIVLGIMASPRDNISLLLQANLLPDSFCNIAYKAFIKAGIQLFREGSQVTQHSLNGKLLEMYHAGELKEDSYSHLVGMWNADLTVDDIREHMQRVATFHAARKTIEAADKLSEEIKAKPTKILQILPAYMAKLSAIAQGSSPEDPRPKAIYANKRPLISFPSGLNIVDDEFSGWLRGRLSIIGGPTGHGKTALGCSAVANLLRQGFAAIYFSPEVEAIDINNRILCNLASITYREAMEEHADNDASEEERKYWIEQMQDNLRVYHRVYTPFDITLRTGWHVDEFQDRLAIIVVDHLHYLTGIKSLGDFGSWKGNEASYWREVVMRLHDVVIANNTHMLLFAQLPDDVSQRVRTGDISNIRFKNSGDIMNIADCGWITHKHFDKMNTTKLYLVKNRLYGNQRECELDYNPKYYRMIDKV